LTGVLKSAREADPDPWRDQFRQPTVWGDGAALTKLAEEVDVARQPPTILAILGWRVVVTGGDATRLYRRALVHHPRDFWLHLWAAFAFKDPGTRVGLDYAAISIRPDSAVGYSNLAVALCAQQDFAGAETAARRAVELGPNFAKAQNNLGLAMLAGEKDIPGAVRAFQNAVELDPEYATAWGNLAVAYRHQGDATRAIEPLRKATELDPKSIPALIGLGATLIDINRPEDAVVPLRKAIELNPQSVEAHDHLGTALYRLRDYPGAIAAHRKAIELKPTSADAHFKLGLALRANNDLELACAAFKKAAKLDPSNATPYWYLGLTRLDALEADARKRLDLYRQNNSAQSH